MATVVQETLPNGETRVKIVDIDPDFSVYKLVERLQSNTAVMNHRVTMSIVSKEIENTSLVDNAHTRVFSSFQKMSRFMPQARRYEQLAKRAESVYVFGIPDVEPPAIPNVNYVYLKPTDQLSKEWFLISYGHSYASALATEELTHMDDPDELRMFKGVWSFDLAMTAILEEWLSSTVNAPTLMIDEREHDHRRQIALVNNIMHRMLTHVMVEMDAQKASIIQGEIKTIIKGTLYPSIQNSEKRATEEQSVAREQDVVVLFSDLRNFSSLAEKMEPKQLVREIINPYLSIASQVVYENGGIVDKFLGDGVLAVFGAETPSNNDADRALNAAREMIQQLKRTIGTKGVSFGLGMASGPVHVGQIGSEVRFENTVIGDAVNTAQRLSQYGDNDAWVSHTVYAALKQTYDLEAQGNVDLKGKAKPHQVYRLKGV